MIIEKQSLAEIKQQLVIPLMPVLLIAMKLSFKKYTFLYFMTNE